MTYIFLKQNITYEKSIVLPLAQMFPSLQFTLVQSLSHVQLFATPWSAAHQASLSMTNSQSLLKLMSIESMMPSNHLILCHPFSSCPQSFPASRSSPVSRLFAIRWPKYWSFGFSISASNEYSELNIARMAKIKVLAGSLGVTVLDSSTCWWLPSL